ncbi:MAG: D-Ala-D-Ala carboxypeptidase family metallohydrolase [Pseudomonadota bacterium]|nr:D-Ala-D-Ala carboxypeptidase family metallohydrolase [Pseudomonadota bacterium]
MMVTKDMKMIVSTLKASVVALVMLSTAQNVNAKPVEMVQGKASQTAARAAPHEPVVVENKAHLEDAEFSLKIDNIVVPYNAFSLFVLPEEVTELEIIYPQPDKTYQLFENGVMVEKSESMTWHWQAKDVPGEQRLEIRSEDGQVNMSLNVFVMVPAEEVQGGRLKYYHIGPYPDESEIKNKDVYVEPEGFIEVTEENQELLLSPHFKLKEFTSKQRSGYPKFVYLRPSLLLKLEMLRREMNMNSINVSNMVIMSGYRTPQYNKAIGNVKFSRHVYGDAADIFVDNDGNYRMDDLNIDGAVSIKDADVMARMIAELNKRSEYKGLIGGLGVYGPKPHRGPFIHVDTRGIKARWRKP